MKQPLWKKWLSYFKEIHVEDAPSHHNPSLQLSMVRGRYQLCTENAIYSYGDLYHNFVEAFQQIDLKHPPINKVLILGFGLASIPIILEKNGYLLDYTAIEIDEQVVRLAKKYELPHLKSKIQLICADANTWLENTDEKFDLLIIDIFLDDITPQRFQQTTFLEKAKERLSDQGLVLYNCLAYHKEDEKKSQAFFDNAFKKVFSGATIIKTKGNWILRN